MEVAARHAARGLIGFGLAGLHICLDARGGGVPLAVPDCHTKFLVDAAPGAGLRLKVREGQLRDASEWCSVFGDPKTWRLWRDGAGRRVFTPSRYSPPPRQITVDPAFAEGEVICDFSGYPKAGQAIYPLRDIDMVLCANLLAESGGMILHAAGVDDGGAGHVFAGHSGAGKSTLATQLASHSSVTVLGEDQVILRRQRGQILVYGTPWHTDLARCEPGGVPLKKLFFLDRANTCGVEPCGPRAGVELLLQNALIPYYNRTGVERIVDTLPNLAEKVPFFRLGFELGSDVLSLIRKA